MLQKTRYFLGYTVYNLVFWGLFSALWLKERAIRLLDGISRQLRGIPLREDLYLRKAKGALFRTYFGEEAESKQINQEVFTASTRKLKKAHSYCLQNRGFEFAGPEQLNLKDNKRGNVFIGFHTVGARRRFLGLVNHFGVNEFGFVARERWQVTEPLRTYYGVEVPDNRNRFELEGVEVSMFVSDGGIQLHSKLINFLKRGGWLFFSYDVPPSGLYPEDLNQGDKLEKPEKYFVYEFDGEEVLIVSTYLLRLLQRSGAGGIPLYARRGKDGKDRLNYGEAIYVNGEEDIAEVAREKYNLIFDFMSENITSSGLGWFNSGTLSRYLPYLRRPGREISHRSWKKKYFHRSYRTGGPLTVDPLDSKRYLITSSSPLQTAIVGGSTKEVVLKLEEGSSSLKDLKEDLPREELEPVLANLWESGLIESVGGVKRGN